LYSGRSGLLVEMGQQGQGVKPCKQTRRWALRHDHRYELRFERFYLFTKCPNMLGNRAGLRRVPNVQRVLGFALGLPKLPLALCELPSRRQAVKRDTTAAAFHLGQQ